MKIAPNHINSGNFLKSSFQPAGRGKERGHSFLLRFMTWKCHMSLLLISHWPEFSDLATPGCKGVWEV